MKNGIKKKLVYDKITNTGDAQKKKKSDGQGMRQCNSDAQWKKKRKQTNERILSIDICRAVAYQNARNCAGASFEEFCIIKRYSIYSLTSIPFAALFLCVGDTQSLI